jgi:hypothetical protein
VLAEETAGRGYGYGYGYARRKVQSAPNGGHGRDEMSSLRQAMAALRKQQVTSARKK